MLEDTLAIPRPGRDLAMSADDVLGDIAGRMKAPRAVESKACRQSNGVARAEGESEKLPQIKRILVWGAISGCSGNRRHMNEIDCAPFQATMRTTFTL